MLHVSNNKFCLEVHTSGIVLEYFFDIFYKSITYFSKFCYIEIVSKNEDFFSSLTAASTIYTLLASEKTQNWFSLWPTNEFTWNRLD